DLRPERSQNTPIIAAESENSSTPESENSETPGQSAATRATAKQPKRHLEQKMNAPAAFVSEIHKVSLTDGNFRFLGRANETVGKTTDPEALAGSGEIFLHDGQLRQYNLLVALGQLFQIEELTQLHLDQAEAKYHLAPGVVTIDELVLRSANIHLSATGTVSFRGKLHLSSRLAIN